MIRYNTIRYGGCCGQPEQEYQVPDNISPHELALLIPGLSLEDAIQLLATREEPDPSCNLFSNVAITLQVRKECLSPAIGSLVTITIPAGRYQSELSQQDADRQAEEEFERIAQPTANTLGTCVTPDCQGCSEYRVVSTSECGEFRRNTTCVSGRCVDVGEAYFVCLTGNCENERCTETCLRCTTLCPTGACPPGFSCINGSCVRNCENAECSSDCPQGSCPECQTCSNNRCVPIQCPAGQTCIGGSCQPTPCNPECGERIVSENPNSCLQTYVIQTCVGGNCQDTGSQLTRPFNGGGSCGAGRICQNGNCVETCIGSGGSCSSENRCCSGLSCFNGTCVSSCPSGYVSQNGECVIDNRPNLEVRQSSSTQSSGTTYLTTGTSGVAGQTNITYANHAGTGVGGQFRGQSFLTRQLVLGTPSVPPPGFNPSTQVYIQLSSTSSSGIDQALNQYITQELNPIFGADYLITITSVGQSTWGLPILNISGFTYTPKTPTAPPISSSFFSVLASGTTTTVSVRFRLNPSNPYGVNPYSPTPNTFTAFGFNSSWQTFSLQSQEGNFNLEGRLNGSELEVRNSTGTRIFGNTDFNFRRLIGTITRGTTVTTTLP